MNITNFQLARPFFSWLFGLLLAAVAVMALSACNPSAPGASNGVGAINNLPSAQQTLADEKALYAAEAAFYGANKLAELAVESKVLLPGSGKAILVADKLATAKQYLDKAREAHRLANTDYLTLATNALNVIAEVQEILQPVKPS